MSQTYTIIIDADKATIRLDKAIALAVSDISRSRIVQLIEENCVTKEGSIINTAKTKTKLGEVYELKLPELRPPLPEPEDIDLDILYEDEDLLVINKQAGLVVHPGAGNINGTLVNALLYHCKGRLSGINGVERPGIVHRLDADTSGVMVIAKSDRAHSHLALQFANRENKRAYYAFVWGDLVPSIGRIEGNIGRHPKNRLKMHVLQDGNGRYALTHYKRIESYGDFAAAKVECRLSTGRTHQIRVHMAYKGWPLIGDKLYGLQNPLRKGLKESSWLAGKNFSRQALHAYLLGFIHPRTGEYIEFKTKIPEDMEELQRKLQQS